MGQKKFLVLESIENETSQFQFLQTKKKNIKLKVSYFNETAKSTFKISQNFLSKIRNFNP